MSTRVQKAKGFTLVEILIVVVILGILAAIVIPQFTNASESAKASSLAQPAHQRCAASLSCTKYSTTVTIQMPLISGIS